MTGEKPREALKNRKPYKGVTAGAQTSGTKSATPKEIEHKINPSKQRAGYSRTARHLPIVLEAIKLLQATRTADQSQ